MKNVKRLIIAVLLIVLICTTLVACNDNIDDNGYNNDGYNNGDNGDELGYHLVTEKKPTADPDPNNERDMEKQTADYSDPRYEFDGKAMHIRFTNSESLNNLFYDYKITDFDTEKFATVSDSQPYTIHSMRKTVAKNGYKCNEAKTYTRNLRLELKYPSRENLLQYINEFLNDKGIMYAGPELYGEWFKSANDVGINQSQRAVFESLKLYDAWDITTGSSDVMVGLIDSGISVNADLKDNIADDIVYGNNPLKDEVPHGTLTAQIIGAKGNNLYGTSGVCWDVKIASLKACIASEHESAQLVINAIKYAKEKKIKILNYSGGFYSYQINEDDISSLKQAIDD